MTDLESSFELLSTMSPKFKGVKSGKRQKKSPHKLSLKSHIRRSAVFDKAPHSHHVRDSSIIILDDSMTSEKLSPANVKIIKAPIIISSTSESENSDATDVKPYVKVQPKFIDIDTWLSDNEKLDGYSEVFSFKHQSFSESDDEKINFSITKNKFEDDQPSGTWQVMNIESKLGKEPLRTPMPKKERNILQNSPKSCEDLPNSSDNDIIETEQNIFAENILDDLYGTSWRANKDSVLTKSEPRKQKKLSPIRMPQTERKAKNISQNLESKSACSDNDIIEDSETEQTTFAENILDDLYGKSWRANKDSVLMKSEPRKQKNRSPIRMPQTERKTKNISQKLEPKSPWAHRLKNICDSDSEISTSADSCKSTGNMSDTGRKLSFSDSEEESDINYNMTPPTSVGKTNSKKSKKYTSKNSLNSSRSSNEINFSESENDSLGTRVRKKLAKKAKSLTTDKSNKKKSNFEIEQNRNISKNKTDRKIIKTNNKSTSDNPIKTSKYDINNEKYSFLKSLSGGVPPWKCHPEALVFKANFKTEKAALAKKLFDLYNDKIFGNSIPDDTPIQWNDRMRGTAGFCYNRRITRRDGTVTRSCRIALATKVLDTADRLRDTLVHEMCHAVTWLVNNVADGHGPYWKSWAHKAMTTFPELPPIKRCHDYQINTKYTYKCVDCGYSIGRHSKSLDIERKRCGYCYGKFEIYINKINKNGEKQTAPATPKGKPTAFALYVKENYGLVKRDNLKHGDVMKILGQKFSEMKLNLKV